MRVHHGSAAVLAALLLVSVSASATVITPPMPQIAGELARQLDSALLAFDVEDWASFINSGGPEYPLSALGSGIDAFGGASDFRMPLLHDFDDEQILTQAWDRP